VQNRVATVVGGLLQNPMSTIMQFLGSDAAKMDTETRIITIDGQKFDMNRAEHIALLAKQLDALEYGSNETTSLVKQQIPFYLDDIRESRGKKRIMTSGLPGLN